MISRSKTLPIYPIVEESFKNLTVLHLDAHADLRDEYNGTPYNHACAVYEASKTTNLIQPSLDGANIRLPDAITNAVSFASAIEALQTMPRSTQNVLGSAATLAAPAVKVKGTVMPVDFSTTMVNRMIADWTARGYLGSLFQETGGPVVSYRNGNWINNTDLTPLERNAAGMEYRESLVQVSCGRYYAWPRNEGNWGSFRNWK